MKRTRKRTYEAKLLPPLSLSDCIEAVCRATNAYSEATSLPASWTSRSWFVVELARQLNKTGRRQHFGILPVETDASLMRMGNFFFNLIERSEPKIDLLACAPWSREAIDDEEYGTTRLIYLPFTS
jgi:hypothetical protein